MSSKPSKPSKSNSQRADKRPIEENSSNNLDPGAAVIFEPCPIGSEINVIKFNYFLTSNFKVDICNVRKLANNSFLIFPLASSDTDALLNNEIHSTIPGISFTRRLGKKRPPNSSRPVHTPTVKQIYSVIITSIPNEYEEHLLIEHIKKSHNEVYSAKRIISKKTQQPTSFVRVYGSESACSSLLNEGVKIGPMHFRTEPPRNDLYAVTPPQCARCQLFGHSSASCTANQVCRRCAAKHSTHECTSTSLLCANCGSHHSASYGGCKSRKAATTYSSTKELNKTNPNQSYAAAAAKPSSTAMSNQQQNHSIEANTLIKCLITILCCLSPPTDTKQLSALSKAVLLCSDLLGAGLTLADTNTLILATTNSTNNNDN